VRTQYILCIASVLFVTAVCYSFKEIIGYRVVALLLLMTVSFLAILFGVLPVISAAFFSAFTWNFFFIPPIFTLHIAKAEDILMFIMYFLIALINTVLTVRIRDAEKKARDKEEKENTIKLYDTLLNSLSHELRTPVATMIGALDTIRENRQTLSEESQAELFSVIELASVRLNRQIDNLLNMSRLESGMLKLKIDWCDMPEIVNSVIQKLIPGSQARIDTRMGENLPYFRLDAGIMEHVIYNLVQNALLYAPGNTVIEISVNHVSDCCVITVSDNGPGFPVSEIPRAFDKFYRGPGVKTGGTGLGLSIVKGFVEAHGGTVQLVNNPSGGSKFTVEIPAEATYINSLKNE
jgi:two-component system sensor histidine kinase KdpD